MQCSFAPLAGAAVHPNPVARFDPEEPDGDYDLNLSVPAQRQVCGGSLIGLLLKYLVA